MKVVLYARCSSIGQEKTDLSVPSQLKALREYAKKHDLTIVGEFTDKAESARTDQRPQFQALIGLAKSKHPPFEAILVWKLSRFARNREDSIVYKSLLRKRGISVVSINEQLEDSPSGRLLEGIIEVIDEFYSANLAEDTFRCMKENTERGYISGGKAPVGYKISHIKVGDATRSVMELDEVYAPIVRRMFEMSKSGLGSKEIAKALNDEGIKTREGKSWDKTAISFILKSEKYTGTLVWNRRSKSTGKTIANDPSKHIRKEHNHPAIVDRKTFLDVQEILRLRSPDVINSQAIDSRYLLSGILRCGKCNCSMSGAAAKSGRNLYYACRTYLHKGRNACDAKLIGKERLEKYVLEKLKDAILTDENIDKLTATTNEQLAGEKANYEQQLKDTQALISDIDDRLNRLYTAIETGEMKADTLAPRIKMYQDQIGELGAKKRELLNQIENATTISLSQDDIKKYSDQLLTLMAQGSTLENKTMLRSFVKCVTINPDQTVDIEFTLPAKEEGIERLSASVLSRDKSGSPYWTRFAIG